MLLRVFHVWSHRTTTAAASAASEPAARPRRPRTQSAGRIYRAIGAPSVPQRPDLTARPHTVRNIGQWLSRWHNAVVAGPQAFRPDLGQALSVRVEQAALVRCALIWAGGIAHVTQMLAQSAADQGGRAGHAAGPDPQSHAAAGHLPPRWERIDRLRQEARQRLAAVESEAGRHSAFYRQCDAVWQRAEADAVLSLFYGDFENAAVQLDRALHVLTTAPEVARRAELGGTDLGALMRAL